MSLEDFDPGAEERDWPEGGLKVALLADLGDGDDDLLPY